MAREKILIVDDSLDIIEILVHHTFAALEYDTVFALNGKAGLEKALVEKPDLVLLDLNMPHMSGFEMLHAMRDASCDSPVIIMTAAGSETIAVSAFRLGVRDYLIKPFTDDDARRAIDRALLETRLRRESELLNKDLIKAEAIRQTVTTLSHHINNQVQIIDAGLTLMAEAIPHGDQPVETAQILRDSRKSIHHIKSVMRVLRDTTNAQISHYSTSTPMIDVGTVLQPESGRNPPAEKNNR